MKDRFYLACFRDNVGSNVGWHCIDGKGYSTDVSKAHTYTREQAPARPGFSRSEPMDLAYRLSSHLRLK